MSRRQCVTERFAQMDGITEHHCESPIEPEARSEEKLAFHLARLAEETRLNWREYHQRRTDELQRVLVERAHGREVIEGIITEEKGIMPSAVMSKVAVEQPPSATLTSRAVVIRTNGPSPGADAIRAIATRRIAPNVDDAPIRKRMIADERLYHIALHTCVKCHGSGRYLGRKEWHICNCVFRRVFRVCLTKHFNEHNKMFHRITIYRGANGLNASYPALEFAADFEILARKSLSPIDWKVFWLHHIFQMDWKYCTYHLRIDRGTFFHAVYRVEHQVGQECMAHGLFPTDAYFTKPRSDKTFQERHGREGSQSSFAWRDKWLGGGHYFDQTPEQIEAYNKTSSQLQQGHPWRKKD